VLEAMRDAGISPGDDVVLTGFSQGGIMAANLASDPTFPYNTVGVVTNGSPIDTFDIPPNIPVYAFQHANDAVPMLDGNVSGATGTNVNRVILPPVGSPIDAHNNKNYAESIAAWEQQYRDIYGTPPAGLDLLTGEVVEHSVFTASEGR
jgi:poly(3-hydroxybutyrate) depolymerase